MPKKKGRFVDFNLVGVQGYGRGENRQKQTTTQSSKKLKIFIKG